MPASSQSSRPGVGSIVGRGPDPDAQLRATGCPLGFLRTNSKRENAIALNLEGIRDGNARQADVFRLDGGMIVEHWDNSEPVPDHDVNSGKF